MKPPHYFAAQWILIALFLTCLLNGCSILGNHSTTGSRDHVYIHYWPVASGGNRIRLAVKDHIDLKGVVTSVGSEYVAKHTLPAASDAACLAIARQRDV